MSTPTTPDAAAPALDLAVEAGRINATFRLARMSEKSPELRRAVATARLDVAAAIIAMDETENRPGLHNLAEQHAVEAALQAFGQAMADLVRGEVSSDE